jgi:hypothetical protein
MPADQEPEYYRQFYVCEVNYPIDVLLDKGFGDSQIRAMFEYYTGPLTACLTSHGITVSDQPTWETFRASWVDDGAGGFSPTVDTWTPYSSSVTVGNDWQALNEACPQNLTDAQLFSDG